MVTEKSEKPSDAPNSVVGKLKTQQQGKPGSLQKDWQTWLGDKCILH